MPKQRKLLSLIRSEFAAAADPSKAGPMQAYMKSEMPFHGVPTPVSRIICKRVFAEWDISDFKTWHDLVLELWRGARFREERYAALNLALDRRARAHHTLRALPLYEEIIVTGAWWDYVDWAASKGVGAILRAEPARVKPVMRRWSRSRDFWKRRTSILCQLGFGAETDLRLLYDCIEPSLGSDEFFLRKAIGCALRQYAWKDPGEIKRYVKRHEGLLSPLSRREALKNIGG